MRGWNDLNWVISNDQWHSETVLETWNVPHTSDLVDDLTSEEQNDPPRINPTMTGDHRHQRRHGGPCVNCERVASAHGRTDRKDIDIETLDGNKQNKKNNQEWGKHGRREASLGHLRKEKDATINKVLQKAIEVDSS